jgi:hypothetical protein
MAPLQGSCLNGRPDPGFLAQLDDVLLPKGNCRRQRRPALDRAARRATAQRRAYHSKDPHEFLLRCNRPGPGVATLGAFNMGGLNMVALNLYHHGDQAAPPPVWQAWMQERFSVQEPGSA